MAYSQYVSKHERPVLTALIRACLAGGNTISVFDGEEYSVKRSTKYHTITAELGAAEEDWLVVRNRDGDKIGYFYLIYDNGSVGDPMIVIADCTANAFCEDIWDKLNRQYG